MSNETDLKKHWVHSWTFDQEVKIEFKANAERSGMSAAEAIRELMKRVNSKEIKL